MIGGRRFFSSSWHAMNQPKETNPVRDIRIFGARQNNLRNLDVSIAPHTLTVITGPSGSGKSSLAFDTLYAEGQRRYVETFSPYSRQFLDRCDRPKVDRIEGVPPAIAIDQTGTVRTSRSTVGTMTELNDYLKLLFAREAQLFCADCASPVRSLSPQQMWESIRERAARSGDPRLTLTFDALVPGAIALEQAIEALSLQGFTRIHSQRKSASGTILSVVVDRFRASRAGQSRAIEAIESALSHARGEYAGRFAVHAQGESDSEEVWQYRAGFACPECGRTYQQASAASFSFNSAIGACPQCRGFGRVIGLDMGLVIPDETKSLEEGAIKPWQSGQSQECQQDLMRFAKAKGIRTDCPFRDLTAAERAWVIEGDPAFNGRNWNRCWYGVREFFKYLESRAYKMHVRVFLSRYRSYETCPVCEGSRLKPEGLLWRVGSKKAAEAAEAGGADPSKGAYRRFVPIPMRAIAQKVQDLPGLTIHDLMLLPIERLKAFFDVLEREVSDEPGQLVIKEIASRLAYLVDVGLGYLTLDRQSRTLSGGEVQRVNLTTALGTNLVDTLFVLDEPSIGLHPRDMDRVNALMQGLKGEGNTLVVVEHDPQVMMNADRIIDMGPGSGEQGGSIVFDGTPREILKAESLTGLYLRGRLRVDTSLSLIPQDAFRGWLTLKGAREHNLKNIDVAFPLGAISVVTGVSGSGKSTLVGDILVPALQRALGQAVACGAYGELVGWNRISEVMFVDQAAVGKTTRSNPVSYVDAFSEIRAIFAAMPLAAERGYKPGDFSFNSGGGRCPTCQGAGFERVEMQFLSDVFLRCPDCGGTRYRPEIREVTINLDGRGDVSIADVLEMTVDQACLYFRAHRDIVRRLKPLQDVGLGYIKLGQPVSTLSGGEAQRLKLAGILAASSRFSAGRLFVFDEPTTGLHFDDISKLMRVLRRLVAAGSSVILVEHNLDVINCADWVVDLGPEGGDAGGHVVAACTPDELAGNGSSYTGRALAAYRQMLCGERKTMAGLFGSKAEDKPEIGKPLQSVWRGARRGDMGIFGAREHNLKNIDVVVPKNRFSVVTGVSGSGKSTLAFGIIFSEGQRRYLTTLNAYARSFVQPGLQPDVERVVGIAPTVAIEQRTSRGGRKSTVATLTEMHHFLRLLYTKLGVQYCPRCNEPITSQSFESILAAVMESMRGRLVSITAPIVVNRKGIYTDEAKRAAARGVTHFKVDGKWVKTSPFPKLARYQEHTIEMPTFTGVIEPAREIEVRAAIRQAVSHGHGVVCVHYGAEALGGTGEGGRRTFSTKRACPVCGESFPEPDPRLFSYNSKVGWCPACFGTGRQISGFDGEQSGEESGWLESAATDAVCPECKGARLNPVARAVRFAGRSICEVTAMSVDQCLSAMKEIRLAGRDKVLGEDAVKEIVSRLMFLREVGLGYLALDRDAPSLSGGEAQRIRLASQLGSNLQGVCYVLDEPTIGLHPRDNERLVTSLIALKDKGNSVIVVEHDEDTIRRADHVIDIGPGAGSRGGELIVEGSVEEVMAEPRSVTGQYLKHPLAHTGVARRPVDSETQFITVRGAHLHNLKNIDVKFPLGRLIALTGVSGSGKSTLARDVLCTNLKAAMESAGFKPAGCAGLDGADAIDRVLEVDQTPIGKTPRSCPATYVGFFNQIRDLYAATPEAQARGYEPTRFSFNTAVGRCPVCEGQGEVTVEMNFLPDVKVPCEVCRGMRFDEETLQVKWQEKSIGDILNMPVDEAYEIFSSSPKIAGALKLLQDVGLGYLKLGQPSSTLSGGEAQRIKLVTELAKAFSSDFRRARRMPRTFYILDEPTVGLHMADVKKLIDVLQRLVDAGNTVLVVEHNLDVIAEADCVIDLGPEGGDAGGEVLAAASPVEVSEKATATGEALRTLLRKNANARK